jgi:hypothetical protein
VFKGNLERMDMREEMSGTTGIQQHKEPRPKRVVASGKQENAQQDLQSDRRAGVMKRAVKSSVRIQKMNVKTWWRSQPLPKLHTA